MPSSAPAHSRSSLPWPSSSSPGRRADRLRSVTNAVGQGQSEEYLYTYDKNSNTETQTKKFGGGVFRSVAYGYDVLDRLTQVDNTAADTVSSGPAHGLQAEYFDNADFTDLKLTRIDPAIDFAWPGADSPDPSVNGETFSARWTGQGSAYSDEHEETGRRDDHSRDQPGKGSCLYTGGPNQAVEAFTQIAQLRRLVRVGGFPDGRQVGASVEQARLQFASFHPGQRRRHDVGS